MMGTTGERGRSVAVVDSPFQMISLIEAIHAEAIGPPDVLIVRRESACSMLDLGTDTFRGTTVRICPRASGLLQALARSSTFISGDPYSGYLHVAAAVRRHRRLVLIDDGAATLKAFAALAAGERPLRRAHSVRAKQLAVLRAGTDGLYRLARTGRVTIVTGLPLPSDRLTSLSERGFEIRHHDFAWSRTVPLPGSSISEVGGSVRRVVLGSSLAADGLISPSYYHDWLLEQFAHPDTAFVPHRRDGPEARGIAAARAMLLPLTPELPAELALRDLPGLVTVATLPSTAALTVPMIRGHDRTQLCCTLIPATAATTSLTSAMSTLLTMIQDASKIDVRHGGGT